MTPKAHDEIHLMRVMGIDPGSRITGIGIIESTAGILRAIDYHCIRSKSSQLVDRLGNIYLGVEQAVKKYQPDMVTIEQVFIANNAKSALTLGHARGSAICAAVNQDRDVVEYSALQIKRAVVGNGNARKEQVQHMVKVLLGLDQLPSADAADALACAICHVHTHEVEKKVQSAMRR